MKLKLLAVLALALSLVVSDGLFGKWGQAQASEGNEQLTVYNPLGRPPVINLRQMAPRLDTLKGKTIYIVDDGYIGGDNLLHEMISWFRNNYPDTEFVFRKKGGFGFEQIDERLWSEMSGKADAMIIGMGH